MKSLTALFLGSAACCCGLVFCGELLLATPAGYDTLRAQYRLLRAESDHLRGQLVELKRQVDADRDRREAAARAYTPGPLAPLAPGDLIPAQTLPTVPTTPKE